MKLASFFLKIEAENRGKVEQGIQHLGAGSVMTVRRAVLVRQSMDSDYAFSSDVGFGPPPPQLSAGAGRKWAATPHNPSLESTTPLTGTHSDFRGNLL